MSSGSPPMKRQFIHAIPESRLGTSQDSLVSYFEAVDADSSCRQQEKLAHTEFSLVVLLSPNASLHNNDDNNCNIRSNISILLGKKLRGFGEGFYNCFGGKLEKSRGEHDNPASGAVREVHEETGINIPLSVMDDGFVGNINFTFEDYDVNRAMKVHLYCVFISLSNDAENNASCIEQNNEQYYAHTLVDPNQIRGCDEIEPSWFHNIYDLPLDQMFADDSLWLAMLLQHYDVGVDEPLPKKLMFDAWFHFHPGGATTNSIMHHFIQINNGSSSASNSPKYTLEQRLYHELHVKRIQNPSIKEFKESWTFANAVRSFLKDEDRMDYVIDVAGGHGALAALFLLLVPHCHSAIVIDPAQSTGGKKGVREAWSQFWSNENDTNSGATAKKDLRYRHECLRTGLRKELDCILQKAKSTSVTVVACHACQHLTDETLQIAAEYGVNVAVMPCCQKDHDGWWKALTKRLVKDASLPIGVIMDLLVAGKMLGWETGSKAGVIYDVKMKLMNESISQQNRMVLCKALERDAGNRNGQDDRRKALAHEKLTRAYTRAHMLPGENGPREITTAPIHAPSYWYFLTGVCFGTAATFLLTSGKSR